VALPPKRVLVALDETQRPGAVFDGAREFAARYRARLVFLHVVVPDDGLTLPGRELGPELGGLVRHAQRELRELADQVPSENVDSTVVDVGEPWRVICRLATELGVDMVLLGSHRATGVEKLFGTTATWVVANCDRTVVVLRETPASPQPT
jgi:universal stress protein A